MDLVNNMKLDKSLEELDPVKMLLFFLAFVAISLFVIFVFIVPSVREYKSVKVLYNRHELSLKRTEEILALKKATLKKDTNQNTHTLNALSNKFDKNKFIDYTNKFFSNVTLSQLSPTPKNKEYSIYELNVTSIIDTPSNFYKFLDSLKKYRNVIKTDFPIKMKANGRFINSSFNIKVYHQK